MAIVAALLWPAVEAIRIVIQPVHEIVFGDYALFELAVRDAWDVTVVVDLRQRSLASLLRETAAVAQFVDDAKAQLRPGDRWVGFATASPETWQTAAAVVLDLERLGYRTVVDARQANHFGKERTRTHPVEVLFSFYVTNDPAGAGNAPGLPVSAAGGTVMTSWRPTG